jgi:hypothetical protein
MLALKVFRDHNGKPNTSRTGGLQLRLRDFTTAELTGTEGQLRDPIVVSAVTLCSFLERREDEAFITRSK